MKNFLKLIGIIAIVAVIGFSMAGCGFLSDGDDSGGTGGGTGSGTGGGSSTSTKPEITIKNNTGYSVYGIYIKPSTSTSWGSNLYSTSLSDGVSRTFTLSQPLSTTNVYDFKLQSLSGGYSFIKYNVSVSEGMIVILTSSDLQ